MTLLALLIPLILPLAQEEPIRTRALQEGRFTTTAQGEAIDGQLVDAPSPPRRLRLAILPDRTTGRAWGMPYLQAAVDDLSRLKPAAVFCVGDLVQGYTRDPGAWDREVDDYLGIINTLEADFYPTAGNHDVISGARDSQDTTFVKRYRQRFGPLYYAVRIEDATIVVLFSDESLDDRNVRFSDEQRDWLDDVLERSAQSGGPIVLLMHRPLWRYRNVDWFTRVHPILVEHGVDMVVAGHFHALQRDPDRDGIEYHVLGVCGGAIDQHPLTGQLNHITLLDLGPDDQANVTHLPVGMTLPDDFVSEGDQQRAYTLKRSARNAQVLGALPDPFDGAVDATVGLTLRNPIDRAISITIDTATRREHWPLQGLPFVSRTPADIRNESTTDFDTPFTLHAPGTAMTLQPGEERAIELRLTAPETAAPPRPPQLAIIATFVDEKSRDVPVVLHRRVPITRSAHAGDSETRYPISAWKHSVYEVAEPDGHVRLDFNDANARLLIRLEDDMVCATPIDAESLLNTRSNPPCDLLRIILETTQGTREFLLEPGEEDGRLIEVVSLNRPPRIWEDRWRISSRQEEAMDLEVVLPGIDSGAITGLQIEIADNDKTYHTQWRRLAPQGKMVQITPSGP